MDDVIDVGTTATVAVYEPSALVEPVASLDAITRAFHAYQNVKSTLLNDTDYQSLGRGQRFVKKSGWRKMAVCFGVSDELVERTITRDDDGKIVRAEVVVRAIAPNGRHSDGLGICDRSERKFSKPDHDIPATAHTRAKNRAFSDLFGLGEVSAEEMQAEREEDAMETWRPAPKKRIDGLAAEVKNTAPAAFKAWVKAEFAWPWSAESCDEIEAALAAQSVPGGDENEPGPLAGDTTASSFPAQPIVVGAASSPPPGADPDTEPF